MKPQHPITYEHLGKTIFVLLLFASVYIFGYEVYQEKYNEGYQTGYSDGHGDGYLSGLESAELDYEKTIEEIHQKGTPSDIVCFPDQNISNLGYCISKKLI